MDDPSLSLPDLFPTDGHRHGAVRRIALVSGGVLCLLLGVVGWIVPVVTGVPFYVLGLVLLASAVPAIGHRLNAWERRLPPRLRRLLRPRTLRRAR